MQPPINRSDVSDGTVPLEPDRAWDLPAGPRTGHAAALNVPCSTGPASYVLDVATTSCDALIAAEPWVDPFRAMEYGTAWTPDVVRRVHELDRPIEPPQSEP